ncbi:hypothetical protein [Actinoallomurus bryophytorum]|nr:hypothetical protein [Actinoallomurus bryophytorum]
MNPAELAAWIRGRPGYSPGTPVVLLAPDARSFASALARRLGADVTGPWGHFVPRSSGELAAGRLETGPDGEPRFVAESYDRWHTYTPRGEVFDRGEVLPGGSDITTAGRAASGTSEHPSASWWWTVRPKETDEAPEGRVTGAPKKAAPSDADPASTQNEPRPVTGGRERSGTRTSIDQSSTSEPRRPVAPAEPREPARRTDARRPEGERSPRDVDDQVSPRPGSDRLVVVGKVLPADGTIVVPGRLRGMTPAAFVAWVKSRPEYESGVPLLLVAKDARSFAPAVASLLGVPVTAPWGAVTPLPSGHLLAATPESDPDGALRLANEWYDAFHTYEPDGQVTELGQILPTTRPLPLDEMAAAVEAGDPMVVWRAPAVAEQPESGSHLAPADREPGPPARNTRSRGDASSGAATQTIPVPGRASDEPTRTAVDGRSVPVPGGRMSGATVAARLVEMPPAERGPELEFMTPAMRRSFAVDREFVGVLADAGLSGREFASIAAPLLIEIPRGVEQPVSARRGLEAILTRMLVNPEVAKNVLLSGAQVWVIPRNESLTSLPPWHARAGTDDGLRGISIRNSGMTAVSEENLLGEERSIGDGPGHDEGYSSVTHEIAHLIYNVGLTDAQRQQITDWYGRKLRLSQQGSDTIWPDGRYQDTNRPGETNYSATNEREFFAQLVNVYLGTNTGFDPATYLHRNNGPAYVEQHEGPLAGLLQSIFDGPEPVTNANPVGETRAGNEFYSGYRSFWAAIERTGEDYVTAATSLWQTIRAGLGRTFSGATPDGADTGRSRPSGSTTVPTPSRSAAETSAAGHDRAMSDLSATEEAERLAALPADERLQALRALPEERRDALALDPEFFQRIRALLPTGFADVAAALMIQIPEGVEQPATARYRLQSILATMLGDPDVAGRLLSRQVRVVVIPKSQALTSLAPWRDLAGKSFNNRHDMTWDDVRGAGATSDRPVTAVAEENLVGEANVVGGTGSAHPPGYSTVVHEIAHSIHLLGLSEEDQRTILRSWQAKWEAERAGGPVAWPDGLLRTSGDVNHSATDDREYFAQAVNTYLGVNKGFDGNTKSRRNNGLKWIQEHEKSLLPILQRTFGNKPAISIPVNPVGGPEAVIEGAVQDFWRSVETSSAPAPARKRAAPEAPGTRKRPSLGSGSGLGQVIDLGNGVRANGLYRALAGEPRPRTAADYQTFLSDSVDGRRPLSFVVNIILPAGEVGRIPEVIDAVMTGYDGPPGRVAFVFGVNQQGVPGAGLPARVSNQINRILGSLTYPAAVVGSVFAREFRPGTMRNEVLSSSATRALVEGFVAAGTHPYISVQDFDQGARTVPSGKHVFQHFDDKLQVAGGVDRPVMMAGGYRVSPDMEAKPGLRDAVLEDMRTRDQLAAIHPLLPYAPEPNLFFDGTLLSVEGTEIRFGDGGAEFGRLAETLNTAYAAELSLAHSTDEDGREAARVDGANNRHPLRGQAYVVDFVEGATATDLSRFNERFTGSRGSLPQSHSTLESVRTQFYLSRTASSGTSLGRYRAGLRTRYLNPDADRAHDPLRRTSSDLQETSSGRQRWRPLHRSDQRDIAAGGRLNRRISMDLTIPPGPDDETGTPAAGVQADEAVLAAHLVAGSDPMTKLIYQMSFLGDEILTHGMPPPVAGNTLFDAVARFVGRSADSVRTGAVHAMRDELGIEAEDRGMAQPAVMQGVRSPFGYGDLINAFVQHTLVRHTEEHSENQRADSARDLAGRAIATHLGQTLVIHLPDGDTVRLEPFRDASGGTVEVDLHTIGDRQTFLPHGVRASRASASRRAIDHDGDTEMPDASQQSSFSFPPGPPVAAPWKTMWPESRRGSRTQTIFASLPPVAEDVSPPQATTAEQTYESDDSQVDPLDTTRPLDPDLLEPPADSFAESAEPAEPAEPEESTEPVEPQESTAPHESTEPVQSTEPVEPEESTKPAALDTSATAARPRYAAPAALRTFFSTKIKSLHRRFAAAGTSSAPAVPATRNGAGNGSTPSRPVLKMPQGIGDFVANTMDAIDATVPPVPRGPHLRAGRLPSIRPDQGFELTPERLADEFGMPRANQTRFRQFADRFNLVLDVRPTNPASRRWLEDGALPKPHTIKSKTINELDVHLGASGDQIGLVGFFRPRLPSADDLASMPEQQRRQVEARYEQRRRESVDLAAEMTKYTQSGEFRIRDGVIEGIGADGEFRPLTGDHDLYNIRLLDDGAPLSKDAYEEVIWLLTHRNMGVQHGAHMYWRPDGAFQEQIFNEIVSKHQMGAAGAEPLIRFSPGEEPSLVFADETATTSMSSEPAPEQVEPPPARRVRWADQTGETTGETTAETTGEQDDSGTAPPPEPMKLADVLDQAQVYVLDDRPVLLRLPGAPADLPAPDPRTVEQLGSMAPPQTVFVIAEIRDGDVVIGDQVVTPAVLGAVLGARAPGYQPFLLSPGSSPVAERLTTVTDGPVLSAPSGVDYDPDRATMTPRADTKGKGKAKASDTASFRLHLPDEPAAAPLDLVLAGEPVREPPSEEPPPKPTTSPAPAGTTPKDVDEMVRSIGVPRAGLPYVPALIRAVQEELAAQGVTVTDDQMVFFVKQLLARYQYLLGDSADDENTSGLMVPIGGAEVLVTFDPSDPHTVDNPAGSTTAPSTLPPAEGEHEGFETVNAGYATGAHVETHSGSTERTPGGLSAMFGYGVAPGVLNVVKAGASIKGVANQSSRSTTHVMDAEGGHVEDNRIEHTLVAYRPNISVKIRTGGSGKTPPGWEKIKPIRIADPGTERLLLWLANSYLAEPAARQVTAAGEGVKRTRLAPHFSASGLTRLPKLFDEIVHTLESQGLKLKLGGATRGELWQKLLNLGVHLGKAVNDKDGYELTLHDEHGRTVAIVQVYSARLPDGVRQVGATSEKRHIEDVRTLIDGGSSGHNLTNTSSVTPLAVEFGLLPLPDAAPDVGLAASVGLTYTETNVDSLSAGRVGLWVQVPRFSGQAGAYKMTFAHQAKVWVRGAKKSPDAKTVTTPVVGRALVSVPEPQAFEHGLPVDGEALKTLPEGDTVPYDPEAIRGGGQRGTETGKDKGKGKAVEEPASEPIPPHILKGKGIGTGLLRTDEATVEEIRRMLKEELRPYGFLPEEDRPFGEHRHTHGNKVESRLDNKELLDKMVSLQSLDTNYDQAHQDGLTFTLRLRRGAAGMDLDTDSAKVTIRAKSREDTPPEYLGTVETFHLVNLAMGMDTAGQGTSHSRKIALSLKFKGLFKYLKAALTGIEAQRISGASDSAAFLNNRPELADRVGKALKLRLTDDYEVTVEYQHSGEIGKIAKDHRDRVLPPIERQTAVAHVPTLGNHTHPTLKPSEMSVAELINTERNTPSDVLDQAIIYYADLAGLREAAAGMLKDLVGPAGAADRDVSSFAGHTLVRSHLKEIFNREYTTDRPFEPGLIRNTFGALDISGSLGPARFVDATSDPFVIGIIKLLLLESRLTATKSSGITWDQLDLELGSVAGQANLSTEWDVNRHWQRNTSKSSGRTGAKELIQLKIDRAYLFEAPADLKVSGLLEKRAKLLPSSTAKPGPKTLENRPVGFLLSEPDALHEYARRTVPLSDTQLTDVMKRWQSGELIMNGDVAAGVLTRWRTDVAGRPKARPEDLAFIDALGRDLARAHELGGIRILDQDGRRRFGEAFGQGLSDPPALDPYLGTPLDLVQYAQGTARLDDTRLAEAMTAWQAGTLLLPGDVVAGILLRWTPQAPVDRDELAATLASRHGQGTAPVRDEDLRRRLQETFGRKLPQPPIPAGEVEIPEYLTREDRGGRFIGANGIESFKHRNGKSTYQIVKERIDKVAPGMLSAGAELWNRDRRVIGRMQGGVDALQSLLAKGRDDAMLDEFLAEDGYTFYLVNPTGWLLSDIVEVTISSDLFSPEIGHFVPNTGTEIYGYGGSGTSMGRSRDGGQALTFAKLNMGGLQKPASGGGNTSLKIAEGHHRGTTRSETHLKEQTKYAGYDGQYIVGFDTETSMRVRRLDMSHRPLNNRLLHTFDRWTKHSATSSVTVPGRLEVQVGRALAESGRARGPHPPPDLRPLPKLPGNSFNTGVVFGDTQRIARKMLERMFEPGLVDRLLSPTATHAKTGEPHTRPVLSLPLLFSRMHLGNHLADAAGGGTYWLPDGIFEPGQSRKRADIGLKGDFYGLEVLGTMKKGSGVGRYNKYQSGTTVSASTDHSRVVGDFGLSGSGAIGDHTPGHSWSTDNGAGRSTAFGDSTGASVNKRDEQHGKEKGPLQLVRMRFRGTLVAKRFNDHLFRKNKPTGHFESDPITGEAYAELYQEQIDDLNRQLHENARAPRRDWPAMERAPRLDLAPLLTDTGGARVDALRAYRGVAQRIRRQAGANTPVVLTADQAALTVSAHEQVLRWAVRTMRDDLEAIRRVTPDFEAPEALARYELRLHALGVEGAEAALGPVESLPDETTTVINTVNALHSQRPDNPTGAPASAPREAAALSLDPAFLGRDVAHELNAHVQVDIVGLDGTVRRTWADPDGRAFTFDPARIRRDASGALWIFDPVTSKNRFFTAEIAQRDGLLQPDMRAELDAYGFGYAELGRLYLLAQERQQTFEQAAGAELAIRRDRLTAHHDDLPELLQHAADAQAHWRQEAIERRRLQAENDSLTGFLELSEKRHQAEWNEEAATKILDLLRAAARSGFRTDLTEQEVREIADGLDRMTFQHDRELAMSRREQRHARAERRELAAWAPQDRGGSSAASRTGGGLTREQESALTSQGLAPLYVPATGDEIVNALGAGAATELAAIGRGRPATPDELRRHLADMLAADLARTSAERRLWPMIDAELGRIGLSRDAPMTDDLRRSLMAMLTSPGRSDGAEVLMLVATGVVLRLRVVVISPSGVADEYGFPSGRRIVLVRLPQGGAYIGVWTATRQVGDGAPSEDPPSPAPSPGPQSTGSRQPIANLGVDPFSGVGI